MSSNNKFDSITVGVAADIGGYYPGIMSETYKNKTFPEAKELFLEDISVRKCKLNDDVFVVRVGTNLVGLR